MKKPIVLLLSLSAILGWAETWDFTQGLPEGGHLRKGTVWREGGIAATEPGNNSLAAGFEVKQHSIPEAFRFEAEFSPLADLGEGSRESVLWDDMYVNYSAKRLNRGLQVALSRRGATWTPVLYLGLSNTTCQVKGPTLELQPGRPVKLTFTYDANRWVQWEFGEKKSESLVSRAGGIAPSKYRLLIGDRVGSNYQPFEGKIHRIAMTPIQRLPVSLSAEGRLAFERGEENAELAIVVENHTDAPLKGVRLNARQLNVDGKVVKTSNLKKSSIAAKSSTRFMVPIETRLRVGSTPLEAEVEYPGGRVQRTVVVSVAPVFAPRMPALMWGFGPIEALEDFGFTHGLDYGLGFNLWPLPQELDTMAPIHRLDEALKHGVRLAKSVGVVYPELKPDEKLSKYYRQTRNGAFTVRKNGKPAPEVSQPAMVEVARKLASVNAKALGDHPAFCGVLPCSEARDNSFPSFTTEHLRYKKETGREVPPEIVAHGCWNLKAAQSKYPDGVVPNDDPVLLYCRWIWGGGDGWPGYTGAIAEEYRKEVKNPNFFSFWDPAVRCPPKWGSGGNVDVLNQWIYAVPEPMNVAGPLEEMFAMAAGRPGQQVMMMTQLICYRAQLAPSNTVVKPEPAWVAKRPRAGFPSIPPDSLQEATWSMLAKPVKGVMYHGWGTIYETGSEIGYCFTNPQTAVRLKELLHGVVARLGPTLLKLGREDSPVAVLESATTAFMGGGATFGWSAPAITFLQRARLDPRVVYEETILRDGLKGVKVLYAPKCRFLTPDIVAKLREFQAQGGVLVGDPDMLAALKPDVRTPSVNFDPLPASDHTEDVEAMEAAKSGNGARRAGTVRAKAAMLRQAEELRRALAPKYRPATDSSSGEIVVYNRKCGDTDYVFALNDKRTFGDYVGPWGMTMEKGLPYAGEVTRSDPGRQIKAVYELSRGGELAFMRAADGTVKVPLKYDTNDGRVLMFSKQRIAFVEAKVPKSVKPGEAFEIELRVLDDQGKLMAALLPVEIRVFDAKGRELDGFGFACAENGVCKLRGCTNLDDPKGQYRVVCRELTLKTEFDKLFLLR